MANKLGERMPNDESHLAVLAESGDDTHGTRMAYELGIHVPWYVVAAWTVFAVAYVTYQLIYLLPDLRAWFAIAS
jgi:hypothetical protein